MSLFHFLLFVHIAAFGVWFGASVAGLFGWRRKLRDDRIEAAQATAEWKMLDRWLTYPSAIVVLLAGGWLMSVANWPFDTATWIHLGMGALLASLGLNGAGVGITRRRIASATDASPAMVAAATWFAIGAAAFILVGLYVMVTKPTF